MKEEFPNSELVDSLKAVRELTTYSKSRDIVFVIKNDNNKSEYLTSPSNPSKTRWLGVLKQVSQYIKAKISVQDTASRDQGMQAILEKIN